MHMTRVREKGLCGPGQRRVGVVCSFNNLLCGSQVPPGPGFNCFNNRYGAGVEGDEDCWLPRASVSQLLMGASTVCTCWLQCVM